MLTGPAAEADRYAGRPGMVHSWRDGARAHLLIGTSASAGPVPPGWQAHPVSLEDLPARARGRIAARTSARRARRTDGGGKMTALTMPSQPGREATVRPVPWRRMAWVTVGPGRQAG